MNGDVLPRVAPDHAGTRARAPGALRRRLGIAALLALMLAAGLAAAQWLHHRLTHVDENDARMAGEVTTIASRLDGWLIDPAGDGGRPRRQGAGAGRTGHAATPSCGWPRWKAIVAAHEAQIRQTTIQRDTTQQTADAQIADARAQLAAADAAVEVATHQADIARADFVRADPLVGPRRYLPPGLGPRAQRAAAGRGLQRQAQAQVASRQAALALATAQLGQVPMLEQQIEVLRAERDALAAQADQVRQEIADRTLRAPFDGIVDRTFIHPGDYVQAGQWLMMMHDPGRRVGGSQHQGNRRRPRARRGRR